MKINRIALEILVNGLSLFLLFSAFVNIDLLKLYQIVILSLIVMNGYLINKKVLRSKKCNINIKQILVALGFGIVNFIILLIIKKLFLQ